MKNAVLLISLFVISLTGLAQVLTPSEWTHSVSKQQVEIGEEVELIFTAKIDSDWYLYSSDFDPDCGPMVTSFTFEKNDSYELIGDLKAIDPTEKYDEIFECNVKIFKRTGVFRQKVKILTTNPQIKGNYQFQVCSDITGQCIPFDYDFNFDQISVFVSEKTKEDSNAKDIEKKKEKAIIQKAAEDTTVFKNINNKPDSTIQENEDEKASAAYSNEKITGPILNDDLALESKQNQSLLWFMIFAFLGGLAALLTPCVFPMIPMTVSFFTGKQGGTFKALAYGLSIIVIYTIIGSAIAPLMGPETANHLSTEWLPNIIFFAVFVFFALSFFGLFDLTLPSSFVNKMDAQADRSKGLLGVFFMAFTLVLVSFSCTGPIVGSILVGSAGGEYLKPILGMFAFSLAFAIPFTLFAIFPGWMSNLPKSGGWLNSVKVVLGFLELALAFKFLSIADQAFHWGILDRDLNIAIWIVIFSLMGLYFLGKLRLPHDNKIEVVSVPRLMLAIATFTFVVYLIPGLWGAPLKALAGYLPPMYTHDFNLVSITRPADEADYSICEEPKYDDFLHLPHGLNGYFDYEQALKCARAQNKPLFIDFTGHGCTNCREMEAVVWSDPEVLRRLKEDYVIVALYVDDKTQLPESAWYTSDYDNKVKKTIGKQNADLQINNLNNNAQPFYVLVGKDEQVLVEPVAYEKDVSNFIQFLDKGLSEYQNRY